MQVCTPELFHQATRSSRVKDVCAQIEDALERKRRGEICQEDYDTMKTRLKSQLPILTPHATFRNGRRLNADAIPSGLSIYDKDHIPDPRGYWEEKREELRVKNRAVLERILLVHVTPSLEGLRLVFAIPDGMSLAEAQRWMSEQLGDAEYDTCVKDLARPSFIVPEEYILYINEKELFKDRGNLPQISQINTDFSGKNFTDSSCKAHTDSSDGSSQAKKQRSAAEGKANPMEGKREEGRIQMQNLLQIRTSRKLPARVSKKLKTLDSRKLQVWDSRKLQVWDLRKLQVWDLRKLQARDSRKLQVWILRKAGLHPHK